MPRRIQNIFLQGLTITLSGARGLRSYFEPLAIHGFIVLLGGSYDMTVLYFVIGGILSQTEALLNSNLYPQD